MSALASEGEPLLSPTSQRSPDERVVDYVISFPLPRPGRTLGQPDREVDGDELLVAILIGGSDAAKEFPRLEEVCRGKKPMLSEVQAALLDDVSKWLLQRGFSVQPLTIASSSGTLEGLISNSLNMFWHSCKPRSDFKLLLQIAIEGPEAERFYAENIGLRLQTDTGIAAALDIAQPPPPQTSPPYLAYDRDFVQRAEKELGLEEDGLFRPYRASGDASSIFRTVDRVRMLAKLMQHRLNLQSCVDNNVILAHFPVHSREDLARLRKQWASLRKRQLFSFAGKQPEEQIRNYFGETTAFYFAWVGFTISAFVPLAIAGLVFRFVEFLETTYWPLETWAMDARRVVWGVFVVVWGSLYTVFWRRHQCRLRVEWDLRGHAGLEMPPPFGRRGEVEENPLNANEVILQYPPTRARLWRVLSSLVSVLFFGFAISCVALVYVLRPLLVQRYGSNVTTIASTAISVEIAILNWLWEKIAVALTRKENFKTATDYTNSLMVKTFAFKFFNTFQSVFYLAFIQKYWGPEYGVNCPDDDCLAALNDVVYQGISIGVALNQASTVLFQFLKLKYLGRLEERAKEAKSRKLSRDATIDGPAELDAIEREELLYDYSLDEQISDFVSLTMLLSYVLVFSGVTPLLGLVALPTFLVRLRVDAFKLCMIMRRPFPYIEDGIGAWNTVVDNLMWIGLFCSAALPVLNLKRFDRIDPVYKLAIFLVLERGLVLCKLVCFKLFPEVSCDTQLMVDRRAYVLQRLVTATAGFGNVWTLLTAENNARLESDERLMESLKDALENGKCCGAVKNGESHA